MKNKPTQCLKCNPCTKHLWDDERRAWVRCPFADATVFSSNINHIPPKYKNCNWEDFKIDTQARKVAKANAIAVANKLLAGLLPKKSLVFSGKDFAGKTFICSLIAKHFLLETNATTQFINYPDLADMYFQDKAEYKKAINTDLIVLQLGQEIPNSATSFVIREFYRARMQLDKYILFTSKFPISAFRERYGEELYQFFASHLFKEIKL